MATYVSFPDTYSTDHPSHQKKGTISYVLFKYRVTPAYVNILTNFDHRILQKIARASGARTTFVKSLYPAHIISGQLLHLLYSNIVALYIRINPSEPFRKINMEAVIQAWNIFKGFYENDPQLAPLIDQLNINYVIALCDSIRLFYYEPIFKKDDVGFIRYSPKYKLFLYTSRHSFSKTSFEVELDITAIKNGLLHAPEPAAMDEPEEPLGDALTDDIEDDCG